MKVQRPLISVICCAHNEEEYVDRCMPNLLRALEGFPHEIIFIADRCIDNTVEKVRKYKVKLIEKNWRKWTNSYAESLQTGYSNAKGKYIAVVDMDVVIPLDFFDVLLPMIKDDDVSISPWVVTYPNGFLNKILSVWEKTYTLAPAGRGTYGIRIILKSALDKIKGFRDVLAVDTDVDLRLKEKGLGSVFTPLVKVYHVRTVTLRYLIKKQIRAGQSRRMVKYSLSKTLGHAIFRLRPFVMVGWIIGGGERK